MSVNENLRYEKIEDDTAYRIERISLPNNAAEIPQGVFEATVSLKTSGAEDDVLVFLAAYTSTGKFVTVSRQEAQNSVSETPIELSFQADNSKNNIAMLKAFLISGDMKPLCEAIRFPVT